MKKPKKHVHRWELDWDGDGDVVWAHCNNPIPYPDECVAVLQQKDVERILNRYERLKARKKSSAKGGE